VTLPLRVVQAVRPQASSGVIAGASLVAAVFAATPFLLPDVSKRLEIPLGATGLLSTAQVASFAIASFLAGRFFRPRRRLHYGGILLVAIACAASAVVTDFSLLVATRALAGMGMGTLTWIAWADATRFSRGLGDVAAVAPVTAAVASPALGWLTEHGGYPWVFASLALLSVISLLFRVDFGDLPRVGRNVSSSKSNRLLLGSLLLLTLGGSAVFVFAGAIGTAFVGLSPVNVAWALSLNALAGVAGTRVAAGPGRAGIWLLGAVGSALTLGTIGIPVVYVIAMTVWGFSWWVFVPAVIKLLAEKSLTPAERVGDAQALMAVGRIFGPLVGGIAIAGDNFSRLSIVGATIMFSAAALATIVEVARRRQTRAEGV
jgi:predicted MFS family arabinose efflux permease